MEDGQHGKSYHVIFRDMIICEIGLNHNGDVEYANEYLNKIIESKADGVLFHVREKSFYKESNNSKFLLPDQFYIQVFKKFKSSNIKCGVSISDITKIPFFIKNHIDFLNLLSDTLTNEKRKHKLNSNDTWEGKLEYVFKNLNNKHKKSTKKKNIFGFLLKK